MSRATVKATPGLLQPGPGVNGSPLAGVRGPIASTTAQRQARSVQKLPKCIEDLPLGSAVGSLRHEQNPPKMHGVAIRTTSGRRRWILSPRLLSSSVAVE